MTGRALGLDTSNYTTSAAYFDGGAGQNAGRLLAVPAGARGLRQSEALFQHVRVLPEMIGALGRLSDVRAVGAATRPREAEGSYMPCFLAGESQGRVLAGALGVPFFPFSHQEGHIAAAAWSAGHMELLDRPHLAWHLSGGTTELLLVRPAGAGVRAERVGGTEDLSAGQLIDRTGVLLGLLFPAGRALDALAQNGAAKPFPVRTRGCDFSLSGVENRVKAMVSAQCPPGDVARFALETVADVVGRVTEIACGKHKGLPVICAGGVASNSILRGRMEGALFAEPAFSADNAMGIAILTWRAG